MRVYLAGTISTDPRTWEWRKCLAIQIRMLGHTPMNPMRYQNPKTFTAEGLHDTSVPSSFFWKVDKGDVARSDLMVLVYWRGATDRQSIGTWMEFQMACERNIPVIVVTDDLNVRCHPAVEQEAALVVETVDEALTWLAKALVS